MSGAISLSVAGHSLTRVCCSVLLYYFRPDSPFEQHDTDSTTIHNATMKFLPTSCLLASLLSAVPAIADTTSPSSTISSPSTTVPTSTAISDAAHLEARQAGVGLVDPDAAVGNVAGAGAVTNYEINSQVGPSAATQVAVVYTQTFARVPDQWPSAKAGVIGMGNLKKRAAEPTVVEEARVLQTGIAGRIRR